MAKARFGGVTEDESGRVPAATPDVGGVEGTGVDVALPSGGFGED